MQKASFDYRVIDQPVLVIGAGAAGARSAIELKKRGIDPMVLSKRDYGDAHTVWARGGINAALGNLDSEDSWEIHASDTLEEGHFINNPDAVEAVSKNITKEIRLMDEWGMDFTRTDDGQINQRYFGAQSYRRTCFAGDYTGEALLTTLVDKAQELGIDYKDDVHITKLLSDGNRVEGAVGYNMTSGEFLMFNTSKIILAAGGHTSVYDRNSSRIDENNGDGVGLAFDAGADLMDMEFVQFHPTGMVGERYGNEWDGRLVTEAVRGEGGKLYNTEGERFMKKYSPKQMELDARDIVARSIEKEIEEGRGTDNGGVYLDISHKSQEFIQHRLPRMYERFMELGVDISEDPMEVAPTSHYIMGGVKFNPRNGKTNVKNLRVIGETTAGVHGANRLGGNSLAETISIARLVGKDLSQQEIDYPSEISETFIEQAQSNYGFMNSMVENDTEENPMDIVEDIGNVMDKYAGIRRTESQLQKGLSKIEELEQRYERVSVESRDTFEFEMANNISFMLTAARATIESAIARKESRGAHYRSDYQDKNEAYRFNFVLSNEGGQMKLTKSYVSEVHDSVKQALEENHELDYHHLE